MRQDIVILRQILNERSFRGNLPLYNVDHKSVSEPFMLSLVGLQLNLVPVQKVQSNEYVGSI